MAKENQEHKMITFAGRQLDQNEFIRRAQSKAIEWMDYQGLKGDERTDFLNSLNTQLNDIVNGTQSVTEAGTITGGESTSDNVYKQRTGQRTDGNGFSLSRRVGFDPNGNSSIFLNGIAGSMNEGIYSTDKKDDNKKSSGKSWSKSSIGQYISDAIFGEGNSFNQEQLTRWADAHDAIGADGKRGTSNRRAFINRELENYKQKLLDGAYNISDEDRNVEIAKIDSLLTNNLSDWELGKTAPWMTHLLFTDGKYYASDEERKAIEESTKIEEEQTQRAQALENYINGVEGYSNPYEEGTDEYNAAEIQRNNKKEEQIQQEFNNSNFSYNPNGYIFHTAVNAALDPSLFTGSQWDTNKMRSWLNNVDGLATNDVGQDRAPFWNFEIGHDDYTGWGDNDQDLTPLGLNSYFDALPNGEKPDDTQLFSGKYSARSNKSLLGKAVADYVRSKVADESYASQVRLNDGSYLIPEFIDWETGKVYTFTFNAGQALIKSDNIKNILSKLDKNSELYKALYNSWRIKHNYLALNKNGGILKAQLGTKIQLSDKEKQLLTESNTKFVDPRYNTNYKSPLNTNTSTISNSNLTPEVQQSYYETAQQNGVDKQHHINEGQRKISDKDGFTAIEYARIGASVADLGSLLSAFIPGYGTAVAAGLGITSTATNLAADMADTSMSTGQKIGMLAMNLGLDVASLVIPTAAAGKITKNIVKLAPKLLAYGAAAGMAPEFTQSVKKLSEHPKDMTVDDYKHLAHGLSAIAGAGRVTANSLKKTNLYKGKSTKIPDSIITDKNNLKVKFVDKSGKQYEAEISKSDLDNINKSKTQDDALNLFRQKIKPIGEGKVKSEDIGFTSDVKIEKGGIKNGFGVTNHKLSGTPIESQNAELPVRINELRQKNDELIKNHPWLSKHFRTDYEMAHPELVGYNGSKQLIIQKPFSRTGFNRISNENSKPITNTSEVKSAKENILMLPSRASQTQGFGGKSSKPEVELLEGKSSTPEQIPEPIPKPEIPLPSLKQIIGKQITPQQKINISTPKNDIKLLSAPKVSTQNVQTQIIKRLQSSLNFYKKRKNLSENDKKIINTLESEIKTLQNVEQRDELKKELQRIATSQSNIGVKNLREISKLKKQLDIYKLGGILKFMNGGSSQSNKTTKEKTTPEVLEITTPLNGALGNNPLNNSNELSGTLGGENPEGNSEGNNSSKPFINYVTEPNGKPKNSQFAVNPTDVAVTQLERLKNRLAKQTNANIYQTMAAIKGYHVSPLMEHYRQWTNKPLEDQISANNANYNQFGNTYAASTSDQAKGFVGHLAAKRQADATNQPLILQNAKDTRTSVDQENAVAQANNKARHEAGEANRQADVALYNARQRMKADLLSKNGDITLKDLTVRQHGLAQNALANYQRDYKYNLLNNPTFQRDKKAYDDLNNQYGNLSELTQEQQNALDEAANRLNRTMEGIKAQWDATHIAPIGSPYTGYGTIYTSRQPFDFNDYSSTFFSFKSGGKMEAAEKEKTRREYEKMYHDSLKLMMTESNKKLKGSGAAYNYYRKLFMQGK